tara:strand:+ start:291 stop:677 length:387 start_codon:yes stop_codon:yes gene_type:complete
MEETSITSMKNHLANAEKEIVELKAGKKAAATRARKHLLFLQKECGVVRKEIMTYLNGLPKKVKQVKMKDSHPNENEGFINKTFGQLIHVEEVKSDDSHRMNCEQLIHVEEVKSNDLPIKRKRVSKSK